MFVSISSDMVIFLDAKRGFRAAVVSGLSAPDRAGLGLSSTGPAIGALADKLYANFAIFSDVKSVLKSRRRLPIG
jgi:hypothetical protein